jgi:hypothetical protein
MDTSSHRFAPVPPDHPFARITRRLDDLVPWTLASERDLFELRSSAGGEPTGYVCFLGAHFADRGFAMFETRADHGRFLEAIEDDPDADIPSVPAVYVFFADADEEPPSPLLLAAQTDGDLADPDPLQAIFATVAAPALVELVLARHHTGEWSPAKVELASPGLRTAFELRLVPYDA